MKADLVDILKEIGRLTKQQKDTNRKLDDINRKFDLVCKLLMREDNIAERCIDESFNLTYKILTEKEDSNECKSEQP